MSVRSAVLAAVLLLTFTAGLWAQAESEPVSFPTLGAENLLGEEFELPDDLPGEIRLVFVAFQQRQQPEVDTWLAVADSIAAAFDGLEYFELPTITRRYRLMKFVIDNGMRSGIPSEAARARTITVFTHVDDFADATGLSGTDEIAVFVLDRQGRIRFTATGPRTDEKEAALRAALASVSG